MTVISKTAGALSLFSCIRDIHKTAMIYSRKASNKATSDTFISTSIGTQKANYISVKDANRKNWLLKHTFFIGANETIASINGYLSGVFDGVCRYLPNLVLSALAIGINNKGGKHKVISNICAAALAVLEGIDFIVNASNLTQRTDYLE